MTFEEKQKKIIVYQTNDGFGIHTAIKTEPKGFMTIDTVEINLRRLIE